MATPAIIYGKVLEMKAAADRSVGEHAAALNACGPKGNRAVEKSLTVAEARSEAFRQVLETMRGES